MVLVQKWPFFQLFFLGNIGQENVFHDILERKNTFLGYKNMKSKKLKNWHFSKGVNPWFWSKNGHFSNFFFRQYWPGKCLLRKIAFLGYKNKKFKKSKNSHFSKVFHDLGPKMSIFRVLVKFLSRFSGDALVASCFADALSASSVMTPVR